MKAEGHLVKVWTWNPMRSIRVGSNSTDSISFYNWCQCIHELFVSWDNICDSCNSQSGSALDFIFDMIVTRNFEAHPQHIHLQSSCAQLLSWLTMSSCKTWFQKVLIVHASCSQARLKTQWNLSINCFRSCSAFFSFGFETN